MKIRVTQDPRVALFGLINAAEAGVILLGGGAVVVGLITGSWILIVGGAILLVLLSWMAREAGRTVGEALTERLGTGNSGASGKLKVKRIVSNTESPDPGQAAEFYGDVLGLDVIMDHGWFRTYGSDAKTTVQVSFGSEGGSGAPVPDLSIEVDDLEAALARFERANIPLEYGPASEPWGVRRFFVRDPFGNLVNILQHE